MTAEAQKRKEVLFFLLPVGLFSILVFIKTFFSEFYIFIVHEDSILEYTQVAFYIFSSFICWYAAHCFYKEGLLLHCILYVLLALGLGLVSIEEVSWGQRILNLENPEYFGEHNVQKEISLHNLDIIQPLLGWLYTLTGFYGAFSSWLSGLWMPRERLDGKHLINFITPEWFVSSYFFFGFFVYFLFGFVRPLVMLLGLDYMEIGSYFSWRDEEVSELFLSMGFFVFAITKVIRIKDLQREKPQLTI